MENGANTETDNPTKRMLLQRSMPGSFSVACHKISDVAILDQKKQILDLNVVKAHLINEGRLTNRQLEKILRDGSKILKYEPNLLEINKKCYIFGDVHGQFYDLLAILDSFDFNKDTLLFLGDYVDRGLFSVETYLYLILLKTHYPNNIYLLRGNHESERMTRYFTFKQECTYKYGDEAYENFLKSFNTLPIAAVIQKMAFCSHAGISPELKQAKMINSVNRFKELEYKGLFCDIVWSDPHEFYDLGLGRSWEVNEKRKCSYKYNYEDVIKFLDANSLSMIIRAHEVQEHGYNLMKLYKGHNSVVTLFSAPCYCDAYQNKGAYAEFDNGIKSLKQFESVPHPFVISGFLDGINWSLPFIAEKIVEFAVTLFRELDGCPVIEDVNEIASNIGVMRLEREAIDEFEKEDSTDSCVLSTIEDGFENFNLTKEKDEENEKIKISEPNPSISIKLSPSLITNTIEEVMKETVSANKKRVKRKNYFYRCLCNCLDN